MERRRVVLIGVVGMSPAVLSETVWALAHEEEPVVVDEVVAITTVQGAASIRMQLLESGAWHRLVQALADDGVDIAGKLAFGASDSIRVIGDGQRDFTDIVSPGENELAADFILKVLRQYTEDADVTVIASIAGGRKTMSALMLSCMSLLGREQDRVCHVLVNPPYEQRLDPPFFFPERGVVHRQGDAEYASEDAVPLLSDIAFVRVRGWYEQESGRQPASYSRMVQLFRKSALPALNYPVVTLDCSNGSVSAGEKNTKLNCTQFALLFIVASWLTEGRYPTSWNDLLDDMDELHDLSGVPANVVWWHDFAEKDVDVNRFNHWANDARNRLAEIIDKRLCEGLIPKLRGRQIDVYPSDRIRFVNTEWMKRGT